MSEGKTLNTIKLIVKKHLPDKTYRAFVFGSRAEGTNRKFSDYDIGIMGKKPLALGTLSLIEEDLENSDLPYTVDVVDFFRVSKDFKSVALLKTLPL